MRRESILGQVHRVDRLPKVSVFVPLWELPEILDTVLASGG